MLYIGALDDRHVRKAMLVLGTALAVPQRDLGGALMQSIFGALLAAGYAAAMTSAIGSAGGSGSPAPRRTR